MKSERPKRKTIPVGVKRDVCKRQRGVCVCGCGQAVSEKARTGTVFDHRPPLRLRDVNEAGTDYIPPQHSPEHIDAVCQAESDLRTFGRGSTVFADFGAIKKERRREKDRAGVQKPKRRWASKPFEKGKKPWPKRKMKR